MRVKTAVAWDLSPSKKKTMCSVEIKRVIVSQHCELERQVHIKMKSVRNVWWMWHCDDTMRPFFSALKCNILPFVFLPQPVFMNEGLT